MLWIVTIWIGHNVPQIFPMHAEDDRYAKFFLFTEKEVEILCKSHDRVRDPFAYPLFTQSFSS
jgi:hypothetical protein